MSLFCKWRVAAIKWLGQHWRLQPFFFITLLLPLSCCIPVNFIFSPFHIILTIYPGLGPPLVINWWCLVSHMSDDNVCIEIYQEDGFYIRREISLQLQNLVDDWHDQRQNWTVFVIYRFELKMSQFSIIYFHKHFSFNFKIFKLEQDRNYRR